MTHLISFLNEKEPSFNSYNNNHDNNNNNNDDNVYNFMYKPAHQTRSSTIHNP